MWLFTSSNENTSSNESSNESCTREVQYNSVQCNTEHCEVECNTEGGEQEVSKKWIVKNDKGSVVNSLYFNSVYDATVYVENKLILDMYHKFSDLYKINVERKTFLTSNGCSISYLSHEQGSGEWMNYLKDHTPNSVVFEVYDTTRHFPLYFCDRILERYTISHLEEYRECADVGSESVECKVVESEVVESEVVESEE